MKSITKWLAGDFSCLQSNFEFFYTLNKALTLNLLFCFISLLSSLWIRQAHPKPTNGFSKSPTS